MDSNKLEDVRNNISHFERLNRTLRVKIVELRRERAREESINNLLKFELSQISTAVEQEKSEVSKLTSEYEKLINQNRELNRWICRLNNYEMLSGLCMEMKDRQRDKLRNKLDTLDFSVEAKTIEPSRSIDTFSQYVWG